MEGMASSITDWLPIVSITTRARSGGLAPRPWLSAGIIFFAGRLSEIGADKALRRQLAFVDKEVKELGIAVQKKRPVG